jgi:hypothetical protein
MHLFLRRRPKPRSLAVDSPTVILTLPTLRAAQLPTPRQHPTQRDPSARGHDLRERMHAAGVEIRKAVRAASSPRCERLRRGRRGIGLLVAKQFAEGQVEIRKQERLRRSRHIRSRRRRISTASADLARAYQPVEPLQEPWSWVPRQAALSTTFRIGKEIRNMVPLLPGTLVLRYCIVPP